MTMLDVTYCAIQGTLLIILYYFMKNSSALSLFQWIKQWSEDLTLHALCWGSIHSICIFMPTSMEKFQTLDFSCQSWPNSQWEETGGFSLPQFVRFGTCSRGKHVWGANAAAPLLQFFRTVVPFHGCICPKESSSWRRGPYSGTLEKFGTKVILRDSENVINYSRHVQWEQNIFKTGGVLHWR